MQFKPSRRSSLFLLELIISILFFSMAAAVCVQLFVKSHTLEKESGALDHSVNAAVSMAEILRSQDDYTTQILDLYPYAVCEPDTITISYDDKWTPCKPEMAVYSLQLTLEQSEEFLIGNINVTDVNSSIYTLSIKKYLGKEAAIS